MNYRRNEGKLRVLTALCVAFAVLAVGLGAWAVVGQARISKLSARVEELEASAAATGEGAPEVLDYDASTVVAEFEGGTVTLGEAMPEYQTLISYYEMLGSEPGTYEEDAKTTVLDSLVERKVLERKAEELGLGEMTEAERAKVEEQAAEDFEENVRYYMGFRAEEGKSDEETRAETIAYLEESGYTLDGAVAEAMQDVTQERLYDYVTANSAVDDAQLQSFYDEQLESAELTYSADYTEYEADMETGRAVVWNPEGVRRVQSILIPFSEDQSVEYLSLSAAVDVGDDGKGAELDALYATLEPTAQQALDRLNGGESFEALMEEYGSYGPAEGSCVSEESTFYGEEFRDAGLALANVGDVSGIVRTDGGLCILRYASDVTPGPVPFEEVKDALRSGYEEELKLSQYNAAVVQWIDEANVQYHTDRF